MDDIVQTEGETTEEAINIALEELGVDRSQVEIEVLEEPNKGLLGLRKARAKVRVRVLDGAAASVGAVEELVQKLAAEATISTHREDEELWITLSGDNLAWLIGYHGQTLDALQVLVSAMISKKTKMPAKAIIDIEGYRQRRKREVQSLAERTIGKVLATQKPISLRPMSAVERKTVHVVAGQYDSVVSESAGFDPDRYVVISPAGSAPTKP